MQPRWTFSGRAFHKWGSTTFFLGGGTLLLFPSCLGRAQKTGLGIKKTKPDRAIWRRWGFVYPGSKPFRVLTVSTHTLNYSWKQRGTDFYAGLIYPPPNHHVYYYMKHLNSLQRQPHVVRMIVIKPGYDQNMDYHHQFSREFLSVLHYLWEKM